MSQTAFILIVTADAERGQRLREALRERHGHSTNLVESLDDAAASIRAKAPDVVVADDVVSGESSLTVLGSLLEGVARDATLVILANSDDSPRATELAPRVGVESLVLPGETEFGKLAARIAEAAGKAVVRRESRLLKESIEGQQIEPFEGIIGVSPAIRKIIERIKKAARNKLTVLILGETGTGKELIAEAIHKHSDRARRPFKPLNCAGLNENLLESELFGHVKGAFTGAVSDKKGYFVAADGGTLFLDEIGDMPLAMQAKLLRALDRREITPVGSTEVRRVDVRVVAATNVDLARKVDEKAFREDLYFRLRQWVIDVPPLRERRQDIPLLAHHLLRRANLLHNVSIEGFSNEAMAALAKYHWPGNIRELVSVVEAASVEAGEGRIELEHLPEPLRGSRELLHPASAAMVGFTISQMERLMIERALQSTGGNREQAAKMLGIGTRTLYRKIKEYGL